MIFDIILLLCTILSGCSFIYCFKKTLKLSSELKEKKNQEKQNAKIDQQTQLQIEEVTTGDVQHDFNSGIELLHELSKK